MKKNRLIHPGPHRIRKWIVSLGTEDSTVDSNTPDSLEGASSTVYLGSGFNKKRDPEHLPATTAWEKFGNGIRTIPHFLGSAESAFGVRVACKFKRPSAAVTFAHSHSGDDDYRNSGILGEHPKLLSGSAVGLGNDYQ
jgi:hypothetical protein